MALADVVAAARLPLVVSGQIRNHDDATLARIGVLDVHGKPRLLLDEWLPAEGTATSGEWDVMHNDSWKYAWGRVGEYEVATLYDRRGARARVPQPGLVELRTLTGTRRYSVREVRGELSGDWLTRALVVVDVENRRHVVARKRELSAALDPTYDGIDLMFDASWLSSSAKLFAAELAVPLHLDEALR